MALKIRWTESALEDYKKVVTYLIQAWPGGVAEEFVIKIESRLDTLSVFPKLGVASIKQDNIRSIVITKHNKLYYRIINDTIEVLSIFDTRQNPGKNKYT